MNRTGATGLGVTLGELRAASKHLPDEMIVVVRGPDGVCGAIWNAGVDTGCDDPDDGEGMPEEFFALAVSDDPDFVRAEDERRKGSGSVPSAPVESGHPKASRRKSFTEGQVVEIVPEPPGRRRATPTDRDWVSAVYRHPGRDEMEGWHFVTYASQIVHVPARRIREPKDRP